MPPKPFAEVLAEAKRLPLEDQDRLIQELSRPTPPTNDNGSTDGKKVRTLYDAFNERGLVGFMSDGPTDLSTNPIHMEGFGRDVE